ncbi:MAG: YggT family protein [Pseudomonadota bacterium]|nr:YggT family protein [Pseudomonadota bacterium]
MYFFDFFAYIIFQILQLYKYAVIIYVIISMLVSFNIINHHNKFVSIIMDCLYKITEPLLRIIRKILPNFGAIDLSPVLLIILIEALQFVMTKYGL